MGLLFLIIVGLLGMIGVARLATKIKRPEQDSPGETNAYSTRSRSQTEMDGVMQRGLISLLLKKKIINQDELLEEIHRMKNNPSE